MSESVVPTPPPAQQPVVVDPAGVGRREPRGTDIESVVVLPVLAVLLIASAIVNAGAASGFPYNAPVEWILSAGITIDLLAGAIALAIRFLLIVRRPRVPGAPVKRVTGWTVTALVLAGASLVGWLLLGGIGFLLRLALEFDELRYMEDVLGFFLLGAAWVAGLFFSALGYRRGRTTLNNGLAVLAAVVLLLLVVPTLTSGILYGLGLTD
jgi:hypothetical protein